MAVATRVSEPTTCTHNRTCLISMATGRRATMTPATVASRPPPARPHPTSVAPSSRRQALTAYRRTSTVTTSLVTDPATASIRSVTVAPHVVWKIWLNRRTHTCIETLLFVEKMNFLLRLGKTANEYYCLWCSEAVRCVCVGRRGRACLTWRAPHNHRRFVMASALAEEGPPVTATW